MMSNRPRIFSAFAATLFVAVVLVQASSCALATYGTIPEERAPCDTDANCDDGNPCTLDTCGPQGLCEEATAPDGPLPTQTAADCKRVECQAGAPVDLPDPNDTGDDKNPCTDDQCVGTTPMPVVLPDGTSCQVANQTGTCKAGECKVACGQGDPCSDNNPCTEDACDVLTGVCIHSSLDGLPTPGFTPIAGDCKQQICSNGVDKPVIDDTDIPDDGNPCTTDICTNGVASNPVLAQGSPCAVGAGTVCNDAGNCVACNAPTDCLDLPADDDCRQRTCIAEQCGEKFTPAGTPITIQTVGDCMQVVCDGNGGSMPQVYDADKPVDNNNCTSDVCTNGTPTNPPLATGTSCGAPLVCDGAGACVGCNVAADCPGTDDFCKKRTCVSKQCGYAYTQDGTPLPNGQTAKDCKVLACDGQGNVETNVDPNDKPVDGLQCTQDVCGPQGTPSNPPEPVNTVCNESSGQLCNGAGACKKAQAQACLAGTECLSQSCVDGVCCDTACSDTCKACNVTGIVGTCSPVSKGMDDPPTCGGTSTSCDGAGVCKKEPGQGCANAGDCLSGFCVDNVCCGTACTAACRSCNTPGNEGSCQPIANTEDNNPTGVCAGTNTCDPAGVCKKKDGVTCGANADCLSGFCIDGVCCATDCTGSCQACSAVLKSGGVDGVCGPIASGKDPQNECNPGACDGMGACKGDKGDPCPMGNAQCLNGLSCADGYCCEQACTTDCYACNITGKLGTCAPVAALLEDGNCNGTMSCNGAGLCKGNLGQVCTLDTQCVSGHCVDGVCCDTTCTGNCQACSNVLKGSGLDGLCGFIQTSTDPENECSPGVCDGAGVCKGQIGDTCMMPGQCLSGYCADGVCCDGACTGTCVACTNALKGGGTNGVCGNVKALTDPQNECANGVCSAGACIGDPGATCSQNSQCLSGFCADGVCCNAACDGECQSCKVPGSVGTCTNTPAGWDDTWNGGTCQDATGKTCDGAGSCNGDFGTSCNQNNKCASGVCTSMQCAEPATCSNTMQDGSESDTDCGGLCVKCVNGKKCNVATDCLSNMCGSNGKCQ
jgi:hypothetical protein